jgi:drug/metabolite transporter (DMT)-like permease
VTQPTEHPPAPALLFPVLGIGVLAVSFAAIFFVKAQPTHPLISAGTRLLVAAVLLSPFVLRARRRGRLGSHVLKAGALGGLCYAVHFSAWIASLERTSIAASVTLVASTPILLALLSLITRKDQPSRSLWVAIGVAGLGVGILGAADLSAGTGNLLGDALALLGCGAIAAFLLLVRKMGPELDPVAFSGLACASGATLLLGTAWLVGIPLEVASTEALGYLVLAALIPQLVGHLILIWALRYTTPTVVALGVTCEPVASTVLGVLLLSQVPSGLAAIGCAVTVGGVTLAILAGRENEG